MTHPQLRVVRPLGVTLAVSCLWAAVAAAQALSPLKDQPLAEVLRRLQGQGLRIVFSSEVVLADMRVTTEPRATKPREVLDEILSPHGLKAEAGPGGILEIVPAPTSSRRAPREPPARKVSGALPKPDGNPVYSEKVMVTAPADTRTRGVSSAMILAREDLQDVAGTLVDDPVRAVQSLARVAATDDHRSEFSVRGSPYRHVGVVVDGVATPWLQHAAYGRSDAGSVAMVHTEVLQEATLQAGAYPQRYGERLGAELGLTLRQGSRDARHIGGSLSGTTAALVAEGPLADPARGSWLIAARQSLLEWPVRRRHAVDETAFGFTDVHAKVVYDARPGHEISISGLAGRSGIDGGDDRPAFDLADGENRAGFVTLAWRASLTPRLVLTQQAYVAAHRFRNKYQSGQDAAGGSDREVSYRAQVVQTLFGGLLETGAQVRKLHATRLVPALGEAAPGWPEPLTSRDRTGAGAWVGAGYVNFQWSATPRLTVTPGLRLVETTMVTQKPISRWLLAEWSFRRNWVLNASAGVSHQLPELELTWGSAPHPGSVACGDPYAPRRSFSPHHAQNAWWGPRLAGAPCAPQRPSMDGTGSTDLAAERAAHAEVGIAHTLTHAVRWQASVFIRNERDVLSPLTSPGPPVGFAPAWSDGRVANALHGSSRGFELGIERRAVSGLTGWAAYSYGKSRHTDTSRHETFWSDFDQRHAVNVSARHVLSERSSVMATFRAGTNFPIPGYFMERDGRLFVGSERNSVRMPAYARLDLRARRAFDYGPSRLTAFVEVLNVLNRQNVGVADGFVRPGTGETVGFTEPLLPRLVSGGLRIEF